MTAYAYNRTADVGPERDPLVFNTELAKLLQRLKRDSGAGSVTQNYRGTGKQQFRRQLWVRFPTGAVIDLWLESNYLGLGGVVKNSVPGTSRSLPKGIVYGDKTPAQIYTEAAHLLKEWAAPGKEVTAMYSYDRTAAGSSSARDIVKSQKTAIETASKSLKKVLPTLARIPGTSAAQGAVDKAVDLLSEAAGQLEKASNNLADAANR